jgi:hypothetical protein
MTVSIDPRASGRATDKTVSFKGDRAMRSILSALAFSTIGVVVGTSAALAEEASPKPKTVVCESKSGEKQHCAADTSKGVALVRTLSNVAPCLLGKTWGYDDTGIWVTEGCSAEFLPGQELPLQTGAPDNVKTTSEPATAEATETAVAEAQTPEEKKKFLEHIPNVGFRLFEGKDGQMYLRIFTYVRYLNQKGLDPSYTDFFGNSHPVKQRQDVQIQKVFFPFSGWFLNPKFRYYLYVWTNNAVQGEGAQVVAAGNISWVFNSHFTLGGGITSLPSVRSTEGQFPYWLGVDDRLTADEFFRGSYTSGFWLKGAIVDGLNYQAMVATNLSILGVSASRLDNDLNTTSIGVNWLPTTKENGLWGTFGDYDDHQRVATRLGAHFTHSREDKQSQPGTDSVENTQIRLTDGSVVFTPDLFGPGISVNRVTYEMSSVDYGVKYKGFSLEGEFYWRWLSNFTGTNTESIGKVNDHGYQIQSSAMVIPKTLQVYLSGSEILGHYGDASEVRAGLNWYYVKTRGLRFNAEWLHLNHCPVGYTAVPYPVGGNGDVFHTNVEMQF